MVKRLHSGTAVSALQACAARLLVTLGRAAYRSLDRSTRGPQPELQVWGVLQLSKGCSASMRSTIKQF
jgi:hypothetical protein